MEVSKLYTLSNCILQNLAFLAGKILGVAMLPFEKLGKF